MSTTEKCACPPDHDARTCFELRHYGYSPASQNEEHREECECGCHYDEAFSTNQWDDDL